MIGGADIGTGCILAHDRVPFMTMFSVENRPGTGAAAQFLAEHAPFIVELNDGRFAGCPQVGTRVYRDSERGFLTVADAAAAINQPTDGWTEAPTWVGSVWIRKAD